MACRFSRSVSSRFFLTVPRNGLPSPFSPLFFLSFSLSSRLWGKALVVQDTPDGFQANAKASFGHGRRDMGNGVAGPLDEDLVVGFGVGGGFNGLRQTRL